MKKSFLAIAALVLSMGLTACGGESTPDVSSKPQQDSSSIQGVSSNDTVTDVIVRGVKSVIEEISAADIVANIDLSGYDVGEYEVDVTVTGSDSRVTYAARTKRVKVRIFK